MKKVLLIRFSSIGDIVLTSPVIRSIHQQHPEAEIHFLTKKSLSDLVMYNPRISKVYTLSKKVSEVLPALKAEKYDVVIDLHKNIRTSLVKLALNVPAFSYHKLNYKKWMLVRLKVNMLPSIHIVDRYFDALEPLGIKNDGKGLELFVPPAYEEEAARVMESVKEPYVVFSIGAAHFTKRLPAGKWKELVKEVGGTLVLAGGKEEYAVAESIREEAPHRIINACGACSILATAAIIKRAAAVITNDTGLMHIATCFSRPVVSVWGSTVPEFGMYPYLPLHPERSAIVQASGVTCRPCSKIGYDSCPKKHFSCMNQIPVSRIREALQQVI